MMTGILYPTNGEVKVLGLNPNKDRIKLSYQIGSVFGQKEQLWVHLSAYDNFLFFGSIFDIPKKKLAAKIEAKSPTVYAGVKNKIKVFMILNKFHMSEKFYAYVFSPCLKFAKKFLGAGKLYK